MPRKGQNADLNPDEWPLVCAISSASKKGEEWQCGFRLGGHNVGEGPALLDYEVAGEGHETGVSNPSTFSAA